MLRFTRESFTWPVMALVRRELLSGMRSVRTYDAQACFVGCAMVIAVAAWPDQDYASLAMGSFSRDFLAGVALVLFGSCVLFVPAFAANAIALERERDTYEMLELTLLRPGGIVLGKLLHAVGFFVLLTVALLPVFSVAFFLVGVDLGQVVQVVAIVLSSAFSCALIGIAVSARCKTVLRAVVLSYLGVAALFLLTPWMIVPLWTVLWLLNAQFYGGLQAFPRIQELLTVSSPVATITSIVAGAMRPYMFWEAFLSQMLVAAICFSVAVRALRLMPEAVAVRVPPKRIEDPDVLEARRRRYPFYLIDPMRRRPPIEDDVNPMLIKELRWSLINRGSTLVRMTYWAVILYFFLGIGALLDTRGYESMYWWLASQIVVALLIAPGLLANTFTKERELGNLDMLRTTLLTPRQIVFGKLAASVVSLCPILVAALFSAGLTLWFGGANQWPLIVTALGTLLVSCALCLGVSLVVGISTPRTLTAVTFSYILSFLALIGGALVLDTFIIYIVIPALRRRVDWLNADAVERVSTFLSPLWAFHRDAHAYRSAGHEAAASLSLYWFANIALFAAISAGLTWFAVRRFERSYLRDQ